MHLNRSCEASTCNTQPVCGSEWESSRLSLIRIYRCAARGGNPEPPQRMLLDSATALRTVTPCTSRSPKAGATVPTTPKGMCKKRRLDGVGDTTTADDESTRDTDTGTGTDEDEGECHSTAVLEPVDLESDIGKLIHLDVLQTLRLGSAHNTHQLRSITRVRHPSQEQLFAAAQEQHPMASLLSLYLPLQRSRVVREAGYTFDKAAEHSACGTWHEHRRDEELVLHTNIGHALCSSHCDEDGVARVLLVRAIIPKHVTRGKQIRRYGSGRMYTGVRQHMLHVHYELELGRVC